MKNIPHRSQLQIRPPVTPAQIDAEVKQINDDIVEAMHFGCVWPGDIIFAANRAISDEVKQRLEERFAAQGWELHFAVSDSAFPSTTIYVAGAVASYPPFIGQPGDPEGILAGLRRQAKAARR